MNDTLHEKRIRGLREELKDVTFTSENGMLRASDDFSWWEESNGIKTFMYLEKYYNTYVSAYNNSYMICDNDNEISYIKLDTVDFMDTVSIMYTDAIDENYSEFKTLVFEDMNRAIRHIVISINSFLTEHAEYNNAEDLGLDQYLKTINGIGGNEFYYMCAESAENEHEFWGGI